MIAFLTHPVTTHLAVAGIGFAAGVAVPLIVIAFFRQFEG